MAIAPVAVDFERIAIFASYPQAGIGSSRDSKAVNLSLFYQA